jgi:low affinity Fe/Cu permease
MPRWKVGLTERFACTAWLDSNCTFLLAIVGIWAGTGPLFHSHTWQVAISTGTTITTFLMVFLILRTQNKKSRALQLKINELVAASTPRAVGSSPTIVGLVHLDYTRDSSGRTTSFRLDRRPRHPIRGATACARDATAPAYRRRIQPSRLTGQGASGSSAKLRGWCGRVR